MGKFLLLEGRSEPPLDPFNVWRRQHKYISISLNTHLHRLNHMHANWWNSKQHHHHYHYHHHTISVVIKWKLLLIEYQFTAAVLLISPHSTIFTEENGFVSCDVGYTFCVGKKLKIQFWNSHLVRNSMANYLLLSESFLTAKRYFNRYLFNKRSIFCGENDMLLCMFHTLIAVLRPLPLHSFYFIYSCVHVYFFYYLIFCLFANGGGVLYFTLFCINISQYQFDTVICLYLYNECSTFKMRVCKTK